MRAPVVIARPSLDYYYAVFIQNNNLMMDWILTLSRPTGFILYRSAF